MVHALGEIHRVLVPGGLLVDARPDSRVDAYVERRTRRGSQRVGVVRTNRSEATNDAIADAAIERAVRGGLFIPLNRGRFWHPVPFAHLAALREYLADHLRFVHRPTWTVDAATRRRHANDPFVIRRAVRYELLRRV